MRRDDDYYVLIPQPVPTLLDVARARLITQRMRDVRYAILSRRVGRGWRTAAWVIAAARLATRSRSSRQSTGRLLDRLFM